MTYCVGLTGGIGSGKSAAAEMFRELGADIVDTDVIARELAQSGGAAIAALRDEFGPEYIGPDGALDRARMRQLVFQDPDAKRRLEAILHPRIRAEARRLVETSRGPYAIVVVPLLLETGAYSDLTQRVVVVDSTEERQIERVARRSGLNADEVRAIMAAQLPRAQRLAGAHDVLVNDGSMDELREQVRRLHASYLGLAEAAASASRRP